MAEIKWIKMATGLPNSRKIKQIRRLPNGDTIALMWIFLMCLAGETNDNGCIYFTPEIPYTDEMLSSEFDIDINTVRLGLKTFEKFGMIEIINDVISLSSWEKWQSTDRLAEIREYNRLAKQKSRERKRLAAGVNDKSMTSQCGHGTEVDKEEDKDIDKEKKSVRETTHTLFKRLLPDYIIPSSLADKMAEWITYKTERKEPYKEQGMKALLRQIENNQLTYGENAVCDLIDESMSNGWKGIIFDRLKQQPRYGRKEAVPSWMNKSERKLDADEEAAIKRMLGNDQELADRAEQLKQRLAGGT